jgi:hypothetical protein
VVVVHGVVVVVVVHGVVVVVVVHGVVVAWKKIIKISFKLKTSNI